MKPCPSRIESSVRNEEYTPAAQHIKSSTVGLRFTGQGLTYRSQLTAHNSYRDEISMSLKLFKKPTAFRRPAQSFFKWRLRLRCRKPTALALSRSLQMRREAPQRMLKSESTINMAFLTFRRLSAVDHYSAPHGPNHFVSTCSQTRKWSFRDEEIWWSHIALQWGYSARPQ